MDSWHQARHVMALVAIGNTLRTDDGIANLVCTLIRPKLLNELCFLSAETFGREAAEFMAGHDNALVVDATINDTAVGSVSLAQWHPSAPGPPPVCKSTHGISWVDELNLLSPDRKPKSMYFFGIEVRDTGWGQQISTSLQSLAPSLASMLEVQLEEILEKERARSNNR